MFKPQYCQCWCSPRFFSKKNILIPNVAEKNILILVEVETNKNIETLLFGNDEISINENSNIFNKVRAYISRVTYKDKIHF